MSSSVNTVLDIHRHRSRRRRRRGMVAALYSRESGDRALVEHLGGVADLSGADRVGAVWVDEYGPGLAHPHVVLDLLSDRPRRTYHPEILLGARERGVPGVIELRGDDARGGSPAPGAWSFSIALGSDGTRAWFLVADSVAPRPALAEDVREEVLFRAGECSSLLLHRDLPREESDTPSSDIPGADHRFPGWGILRDLEGADESDSCHRLVTLRFAAARPPLSLLEEDLVLPEERRREQVVRLREELTRRGASGYRLEGSLWDQVLRSFECGDLAALASGFLDWGRHVESVGHRHGAGELLEASYAVAAAVGDASTAVDAAQMAGRSARHRGDWNRSSSWYETARSVTEAAGWPHRTAVVLEGSAIGQRERGNLPAARQTLVRALEVAEESGDSFALARVHHGFLNLEQASTNLEEAARHGWKAVTLYEREEDRVRGLAGLGGLLLELGDLPASEDAWTLVLHLSGQEYYRMYATDALSHIAALHGDGSKFARLAAESDALGWSEGPTGARAEILFHRGLSYRALGQVDEARRWLERTIRFADEAGLGRTLFEAEAALAELDDAPSQDETSKPEAPPATWNGSEVGVGLQTMRETLVGA